MIIFNANGIAMPCATELADQCRKAYGITDSGTEVTDEEWDAAGGLARIIDGAVFFGKTDAEKLAEKQQLVKEKVYRLITAQSDRLQRYERQAVLGVDTTDTAETYKAILQYIQDLRDVNKQDAFSDNPDNIKWPELSV